MTTPIRPNIRKGFKPMWNPMIQFLLIRVLRESDQRGETNMRGYRLGVCLANTFGNDFGVTFTVTRVLAVLALVAGEFEEEFAAEGTAHHLVEIFDDEFVAVDFVGDFTLADRALAA
jgi:hypothetical protein